MKNEKHPLYNKMTTYNQRSYDMYADLIKEKCSFGKIDIIKDEGKLKPIFKCTCKDSPCYNQECSNSSMYACYFKNEELEKRKGKFEKYIQFGKYKYEAYSKLPESYVAWLLKQDNLDTKFKNTLYKMIIQKYENEIINNFINTYYDSNFYCRSYNNSPRSSKRSNVPMDFDYGGDLFDAMQGCVPNGY